MGQIRNEAPRVGPKMAALPNERWRDFVRHWLDLGGRKGAKGRDGKATDAAERAGFTGTREALRVTAYRLVHDQRIQEAIQEEARKMLVGAVPAALSALSDMVEDAKHKDRLGAAKAVLDRAGLHEVTEQKHTYELVATDPAMIERVRQMARRLNVPMEQLLGTRAARGLPAPLPTFAPTEDAEYEEVEAAGETQPSGESAALAETEGSTE